MAGARDDAADPLELVALARAAYLRCAPVLLASMKGARRCRERMPWGGHQRLGLLLQRLGHATVSSRVVS